ncbi:S-Ena type endospore appendage [Paenibacillus aceris]|uniref:Endospore appendages core domain-containing protein n=1 Tax=Paenibacillus aceris TaxID=869555 RepID=A0ABS4IA14_9BACL|nr:hypothetical protein [Paenibacillus aceris]
MEKKCKRKRTIECNRQSKTRKRVKKCDRHSRTRKRLLKKLIFIHRCVPINQKCDSAIQTYFCVSSDSCVKNPTGTITIINTSKSCTMQITITKSSSDHEEVEVGPNSSFTAIFNDLKSVKILCKGQSNKDIDCTGTMELDLHYTLCS